MYKEIYQAIKTILDGVPEIEQVSMYNNGKFEAYPAVNISSITRDREYSSIGNCHIQEEGEIVLTVFQEINAQARGAEDGEAIVVDLMDKIDNAFDGNVSLGGYLKDLIIKSTSLGFQNIQTNTRTYNITLAYKAMKYVGN